MRVPDITSGPEADSAECIVYVVTASKTLIRVRLPASRLSREWIARQSREADSGGFSDREYESDGFSEGEYDSDESTVREVDSGESSVDGVPVGLEGTGRAPKRKNLMVTRNGSREPSPKRARPAGQTPSVQPQALPARLDRSGRTPKRKTVTRHGSREPSPKRAKPAGQTPSVQPQALPATLEALALY